MGEGKDCFSTDDIIKVRPLYNEFNVFTSFIIQQISPQSSVHLEITFTVKHLTQCNAVLLLLGRNGTCRPGRTVAFTLNGVSTFARPTVSIHCTLYT